MVQIKDFWNWFSEYHEALYNLLAFSEHEQDYYYNELTIRLDNIHPNLGFELALPKDGSKAQFTITTDGQADGMFYVSQLASLAPEIPNWEIQAFIQPKISIEALKQGLEDPYEFNEFDLKPSHIFWAPVDINPDTYKYEFMFHFKGLQYRNLSISYDTGVEYLTYILLALLGEKQVNQQIQMIYYYDLDPEGIDWYPLYRLPEFLEHGELD